MIPKDPSYTGPKGLDLSDRALLYEVESLIIRCPHYRRACAIPWVDAEDLLQECRLRILTRQQPGMRSAFDRRRASLGGYVYLVLRGVIANYIDKGNRRRAHETTGAPCLLGPQDDQTDIDAALVAVAEPWAYCPPDPTTEEAIVPASPKLVRPQEWGPYDVSAALVGGCITITATLDDQADGQVERIVGLTPDAAEMLAAQLIVMAHTARLHADGDRGARMAQVRTALLS